MSMTHINTAAGQCTIREGIAAPTDRMGKAETVFEVTDPDGVKVGKYNTHSEADQAINADVKARMERSFSK